MEKKGVKVQFTVFVFVCSVRRKLTENSQVFFVDKRLCFPQWGESIWATPLWQKRGGIWYRPHLPHLPPVSLLGCTGAAAQEHKTEIEEKKTINETNNLNDTNKPYYSKSLSQRLS